MSRRTVDAEIAQAKRQLRAEIARSRQQTSATISALSGERRRLSSWRTYVRRFPTATLGTAFGVGLLLAAARPGRQISRAVASNMIQWGLATARSRILSDLVSLWDGGNSSGPGRD